MGRRRMAMNCERLLARLAQAESLLGEMSGDYRAALGVTKQQYDNWCRLGAQGPAPNDTWPSHCARRADQIGAFLAEHDK
jgi:hypothetical protein